MAVTLQEQAKALGDPNRHSIFRYIADADRPVDIAELTAHASLNHNAIRQHLAKLVDAALVIGDRAPSGGRGRPRLLYRLNPKAESRWDVTGPYERLSVLLAEILRTGDSALDVGRRSIRRRHPRAGVDADPVALIAGSMERQGFDPVVRRRGDRIEIVLHTCPYATAALADSNSVCALHLGMAEGLAALTGDEIVIDELVAHDPRRAKCRLRMHLSSVNE